MDNPRRTSNRRTVLKTLGAVLTASLGGLAGCADRSNDVETEDGMGGGMDGDGMNGGGMDGGGMDGGGMDGGEGGDGADGGGDYDDAPSVPGSNYPVVDEWLTETEVGGAADTYEGSIVDLREERGVTIAVGSGNGFAFGPPAVAVSTGTEILWDWTGEGGQHNVVAAPDAQIGESDYVFDSGQLLSAADTEYTDTFEETGVALYQCEPHLAMGMKGAVVVE